MTEVFIDTSGFYAFLDGTDPRHAAAARLFQRAADEGWDLVTTSYVVHECWALLLNRIGWPAIDDWTARMLPHCRVVWVDERLHALGAERCRQVRERSFGLTDGVSLAYMRQAGIRHAIAFDRHFDRDGIVAPRRSTDPKNGT